MDNKVKKIAVTDDVQEPIVKELEPMKQTQITINLPVIIIAVAIIAAGVFTGYTLANSKSGKAGVGGAIPVIENGKSGELQKVVGQECVQKSGEIPEGILKAGGIDGEGTHHLERDGGPSRNVYLTSSVVPLENYIDKKVRVCGDTFQAEKAGWLIDVIRLEMLE
jgi:hypothetical protein